MKKEKNLFKNGSVTEKKKLYGGPGFYGNGLTASKLSTTNSPAVPGTNSINLKRRKGEDVCVCACACGCVCVCVCVCV